MNARLRRVSNGWILTKGEQEIICSDEQALLRELVGIENAVMDVFRKAKSGHEFELQLSS
jgi:hypothetical protein